MDSLFLYLLDFQDFFYDSFDFLILAVCKEVFLELCSGEGALDKLAVKLWKNIRKLIMGDLLDGVQDLFIALFGYDALLGISATTGGAEELFKDVGEV